MFVCIQPDIWNKYEYHWNEKFNLSWNKMQFYSN